MNGTKQESAARTCIACNGELQKRWAPVLDPQSHENFAILRCIACGLGHTEPLPADLGPYYGAAYYGEGKRHGASEGFRFAQRLRLLQRAQPRGGRVLDIGCGSGAFALVAREAGWEIAGTDRGEAAEIARGRGVPVAASIEDLEGGFDAITSWHSLEHFPDPKAELERAHAALAEDGRLLVAVPDAGGWQARLHGRFGFALDVPRHLYHFDRASFTGLLEKTGFEVLQLHHQELEYDLFGWLQSTLNALLPTPNLLFQRLTGVPVQGRRGELALSLLLATALALPALLATLAATAAGHGGTLIAIARRR